MDRFYELVEGYLKEKEDLKNFELSKTLFLTRCCAVKASIKKGTAEQLYVSNINQKFYKTLKNLKLNYATVSDFYGIVYPDEVIDNYNLHPSQLDEKQKKELIEKIKFQLGDKYDCIIFYNSSPLMSVFYLRLLNEVGLKIYFISNLDILTKTNKKKLF